MKTTRPRGHETDPYAQTPRPFSAKVLDGAERAPSRAMLYPVGFKPEDFSKPLIGIASTWSMVIPCNMHLDQLAREAEAGANAAGGKAIIFDTITISDGISMGTDGMKYSLVSREVIADSIETVVACEGMDGFVAIGGCDKNMPGSLIAMARLNRPAVFVYGGTILPGCITGDNRSLDIVSVFEAVGAHAKQRISDKEFKAIESCAIPGAGACGAMYTANTMASAIEAMGMSLPNSSAQNAVSEAKKEDCRRAGAAVVDMLKRGLRPLDIMTRRVFENAITVVIALGGSTNAVLHLLAMAHACNVRLTLDDFTRIGKRVPVLADLKPSGRHLMSELVAIGGIRPLMKTLLDAGLLHGDCLTVTGQTMAETLAEVAPYPPGQAIIAPLNQLLKKESHLVILSGNLAPEGGRWPRSQGKKVCALQARRACSIRRRKPWRRFWRARSAKGTSSSFATKGPKAARACARCLRRHRPSWARDSARMSRSSPTAASPGAAMVLWSATSHRKLSWAVPSLSSGMATP